MKHHNLLPPTVVPALPDANLVRQQNYPSLPLPAPYDKFLGNLPRTAQFTMLLYGAGGTGKSTLSLKLADLFAKQNNARVLYNANEEPIATGTLKLRLDLLNINDKRIEFLDTALFSAVLQYLKTGRYKYCFIDSVNNFDVPDTDVLQLQYLFPEVSFVFLSQVNKSGKAKSDEELKHLVYAVYKTERDMKTGVRRAILEKSRYGATMREMTIFQA